MTLWLRLSPFEGTTRILNTDLIAEFQIKIDSQKNYTLLAVPLDVQSMPVALAKSNNDSQVYFTLSQLIQFKNRYAPNHTDMFVEIRDYSVFPISF